MDLPQVTHKQPLSVAVPSFSHVSVTQLFLLALFVLLVSPSSSSAIPVIDPEDLDLEGVEVAKIDPESSDGYAAFLGGWRLRRRLHSGNSSAQRRTAKVLRKFARIE